MFSSPSVCFHIVVHLVVLAAGFLQVHSFDNSRSDNMAIYWGQGDGSGQKLLAEACSDDSINAIPLAFVTTFFSKGGLPLLDLSDTCSVSGNGAFHGTNLPKCEFLANDIKECQNRGKIVTISLGGGGGSVGFDSAAQAETLADTIWNTFLGGSSDTRLFGDVVLDGIDLDIEGGSNKHYSDFVTKIRSYTDHANKKYYVTAAPQCVFPDQWVGNALDSVPFDAVYVQCKYLDLSSHNRFLIQLLFAHLFIVYNNYCGLQAYNDGAWNFETWDKWAKTKSKNPDVKIYIGAPASKNSADSGYVNADELAKIAKAMRNKYTTFGGIMLWQMSSSYENGKFHAEVKAAMGSGSASKRDDGGHLKGRSERRSDRFVKIANRRRSRSST